MYVHRENNLPDEGYLDRLKAADFATAIKAMVRPSCIIEPDPNTRAMYDQIYRNVYQPMYKHLQPLYHVIHLMGYF